jgi:O-antigen/teichoic acid export membrane protein
VKLDFRIKNFRVRRIFLTFLSILGNKGVTIIVGFISLPLTLNYLGEERYGMMATIVSFLALMSFADFGLGYGLQNRIPELEKDEDRLHSAISSTFFFLAGVAFLLILFFTAVYSKIEWYKIFNVDSNLARLEAADSIYVLFVLFVINVPLSIVQKVQGGFQEGYFNNLWSTFGSVIGLGALYYCIKSNLGVPYIILAIYGANTLSLGLNFASQFINKRRRFFPSFKMVDLALLKLIVKDGLYFTIIQVAFSIFNASDNILISQVLGPAKVASYVIGLKVVTLLATPIAALMGPVLPAMNDAIEKRDKPWVSRTFKYGMALVFLLTIISFLFIYFFANPLIEIWLGEEHVLGYGLLMAFEISMIYHNGNNFISYLMMSQKMISKMVVIFPLSIAVCLIIKLVCINFFGLPGLITGATLGMLFLYFIPSYFLLRNMIRKVDQV